MSITLFDLVWRCQIELGTARTGTATGGTTSTLIDTNGLKLVENDYYNEGSLYIIKDNSVSVTDISKSYSGISDYNSNSKTVTLYSTLAEAVASGDTYGIANRRYPIFLLVQKINNVLVLDGDIPVEDTSLTTVADQLIYTLPSAIVARDLRQVLVAQSTSSTAPEYIPVVNWRVAHAAAGSTGSLHLDYALPAGYTMLLRYASTHAELIDADDTLHDAIHPDRVVYQTCADALRWYKDKTRLRHLKDSIEMMEVKAQRAKDRHPLPPLPSRQAKVMKVSRSLEIGNTGRY